MKYISFFLAACVLFFNGLICAESTDHPLICPSSNMRVESFETSNKQTTILLDNGTLWCYKDTDLFDNQFGWQLGDRVHIVYVYLSGYYLKNVSYQGCVPVKLINSRSEKINTLHIQAIIKDQKSSTYTLVLDDNTQWFIGSWSGAWMSEWQIGDRIIVTPQEFLFGKANYLLLNLERGESSRLPSNVRAQLIDSPYSISLDDVNLREPKTWKVFITNVSEQNNSLLIELNNKTIWQCALPKKLWQVDDQLMFVVDNENLKLKNLRTQERINASIVNGTSQQIQTPVIQKIVKGKNKVVLDDQSIWQLSFGNRKKWNKGDRIIIASLEYLSIDTTTHLLINIDLLNGNWESRSYIPATLVR
jgi:hypothetical protein